MRLRSFRNYTNVLPDDASEYRAEILASANPSSPTRYMSGRAYLGMSCPGLVV